MRTATLIVAAVSSLSLAAPVLAQQAVVPAAPAAATLPPAAAPVARLNPPQRPGGWTPRPGGPRPGGWQPTRPPQGGWKPQPGGPRPGGWQPTRPPQGGWKPGTPPRPGMWKPGTPRPGGWQRPGRWGQKIDGRWAGGWKAPGGWGAYRRPVRGWTLPSYWIGGGFWITDWSSWGLSRPAAGYDWVRYYDDAVLIDRRGRVWDSVSGLDWDRDDYAYDEAYEGDDGYPGYGADYDAPDYADGPDYDRRDYERGERYRDRSDRYEYRETYRAPLRCVANCYGASGYYYGAPVTTTVVIQSAPVVTTTTTVTEEYVTYGGRKVVRRAPTKKLYRAPAKSKTCYCR